MIIIKQSSAYGELFLSTEYAWCKKMPWWKTKMFTNNVSVQGNDRTRCSNSLVKGPDKQRGEEECCHKKKGERRAAEATPSHSLKRQCCQLYKIPFSVLQCLTWRQ